METSSEIYLGVSLKKDELAITLYKFSENEINNKA